jgi:hypothetical protein
VDTGVAELFFRDVADNVLSAGRIVARGQTE